MLGEKSLQPDHYLDGVDPTDDMDMYESSNEYVSLVREGCLLEYVSADTGSGGLLLVL